MKPGLELDTLIEQKIFPDRVKDFHISREFPFEAIPYSPFNYSTDIAAAWEIIESFRNHKYYSGFEIRDECMNHRGCEGDRFCVSVYICTGHGVNWVCAKTVPHAICLSALEELSHE